MFEKLASSLYQLLFGKASMTVFVGKNLVGLMFSFSAAGSLESALYCASPWLLALSADLLWFVLPWLYCRWRVGA